MRYCDTWNLSESFSAHFLEDDPFGQSFLERIAKTTERAQRSRLKKIEQGLR
jgi:hypothetical protein